MLLPPSTSLRAAVPPVQASAVAASPGGQVTAGRGLSAGGGAARTAGVQAWGAGVAPLRVPQPPSLRSPGAMGSVGSQRLKEPGVVGAPGRSVVTSFSFDSCQLEEEAAAGAAQGPDGAARGAPILTDSGERGCGRGLCLACAGRRGVRPEQQARVPPPPPAASPSGDGWPWSPRGGRHMATPALTFHLGRRVAGSHLLTAGASLVERRGGRRALRRPVLARPRVLGRLPPPP